MNKKPESAEEFNSLLVEYLNTFNLLEKNVGLCISHLEDSSTEDVYKSLANTSCEKKIENLYEIVKTKNLLKSDGNLKELKDWCENAHQMRHQRNKYMHGHWSFLPHLEHGVELNVAPWVKEKYGGSERMSFQDLNAIVQEIKECFKQLCDIRRKNGI